MADFGLESLKASGPGAFLNHTAMEAMRSVLLT